MLLQVEVAVNWYINLGQQQVAQTEQVEDHMVALKEPRRVCKITVVVAVVRHH
jgi:hypothetical protein